MVSLAGCDEHLAPCTSEAGDYLSFDFTEYAWYDVPSEFAGWLSDGWTGMTALGLAGSQSTGMGWITETMVEETGRYAYFSLRFYLEDERGYSRSGADIRRQRRH